jgi:hypothetical protein
MQQPSFLPSSAIVFNQVNWDSKHSCRRVNGLICARGPPFKIEQVLLLYVLWLKTIQQQAVLAAGGASTRVEERRRFRVVYLT